MGYYIPTIENGTTYNLGSHRYLAPWPASLLTASNAAAPLSIPTPEGNEAVHPDVHEVNGLWYGFRYIMVFCSYMGGESTNEKICIVASDDGQSWVVPDGVTNPFVTGGSVNADPDFILGQDGVGYVIWQPTQPTDRISESHSSDGYTWSEPTDIIPYPGTYPSLQSPAVIWDGSQYVMYCVDTAPETNLVMVRTADAITGPWSDPAALELSPPAGLQIWHIDVVYDGTYYWMLMDTEAETGAYGYLLRSADGSAFTYATNKLLAAGTGKWDSAIYRMSGVRRPTGFDLWYSAYSAAGWYVGYTQALT